jgi:type II secretory pathway pseudopilin PulG
LPTQLFPARNEVRQRGGSEAAQVRRGRRGPRGTRLALVRDVMRRSASPPPDAGFTLVELAVIFGLIGFLAMLAVPSLISYQRRQDAREQAQFAADTLEGARALAIQEGNPYIVLFEADGSLTVIDDDDGDFATDAGEVTRTMVPPQGNPEVGPWQTGSPSAAVVPEDIALGTIPDGGVTFPDDVVRGQPGIGFNPQGFPISLPVALGGPPGAPGTGAGSLYITDNDDVTYAATLLPLGGTRVRLFRPSLGDWY